MKKKTNSHLTCLFGLRESVRRKHPEHWPAKSILHDKASSHNALGVQEFLVKKSTRKMAYPPNSADLATTCDFCLFPKLKNMKEQKFTDI